ncbi:MAG TPA: DUF559 domain-containing protein [Solirubrobacteraceae bacterium]|nr:DUF559 domain-containing protein [Solirubrobacteraceae bacterium]
MTTQSDQAWRLARRQHWVVTRAQLLELGFTLAAIRHRVAEGRLHRVARGVYAVGRPDLTKHGRWMAAVLSCGPQAALSHHSAAALYEIAPDDPRAVHVSIPASLTRRRPGVVVHRRAALSAVTHRGIRVTTPAATLADLARVLTRPGLEAAVIEADKRDLVDAETVEAILGDHTRTDSVLERRFLALARGAGLPKPLTQAQIGRHRVDFLWPQLGLVVETDGLRYHRTPAQQAKDRRRDQELTAAGFTVLRFTHAQVLSAEARATLLAVAARLSRSTCAP